MRLLRLADVEDLVKLRRAAIYKRIKSGHFPRPVKLGRASRWIDDEVIAFMREQRRLRDE